MVENFENKVVNGMATRKKYVSPEIEVIDLDEQPKLLAGSAGAGTQGLQNGGYWEDE